MHYQPLKEEPTSYLNRLLEVVEDAGIDTIPFLDTQNLSREQVANPQVRISYSEYFGVIEQILDNTNIPGLALQVGQHISLKDHGILGYAFLASANLLKGMEIFTRFERLLGPPLTVNMWREGDQAVYTSERLSIKQMDKRLYCFAVESWVAETNIFRSLFETELTFNSAQLDYPEPPWSSMYRDLLGCDVEFGTEKNELRFPAEFLDMTFSLAEPSVVELCTRQCEIMLQQIDSQPNLVEEIRRLLLSQPGPIPSLEAVARLFFISPRTLRRRLSDANMSFRDIVGDVRMQLAREYLSSTALTVSEIAYLLGYSDLTSFHRRFRKSNLSTPSAYRQKAYQQLGWVANIDTNRN